ncbi:MAG: alpha/beta hydrolase-fold protein [Gammaproteobacteria bacterium]
MRKLNVSLALVLTACVFAARASLVQAAALKFDLSFPASAHQGPITGRAFVFITESDRSEPRLQIYGYNGSIPFFGKDVSGLEPGQTVVIDASSLGTVIDSLKDLPAGDYYVQGLMNVYTRFPRADGHVIWAHMDEWGGQQFNTSPGNLVSAVEKVHLDPASDQTVTLALDRVLSPHQLPEDTAWVKHLKIESPMLTKFWGHPIFMGATVLLPKGYAEHPKEFYPVVYVQGHFSLRAPYGFTTTPSEPNARSAYLRKVFGIETGYQFYQEWDSANFPRMILVTFQTPTPYYDDSYTVNSVNSGPYDDAIMQELIPYVETHFRIIRKPGDRMLTGGSTGGWESMNLMLKHPESFGGTWTFYPDPLDFHHFQSVDVYQDSNAFWAPGLGPWLKTPRYMSREPDGQPLVDYQQMSQAEAVEGTHCRSGQQLCAFFASWGPIGADGYPVPFWNLRTGAINETAVDYARNHGFDLTAYLKKNWTRIGPELVGKIHVYVGDMDTYYLNLGVYDMQNFLKTTQDPHYTGTFVYGRPEKPHGWNGGMTNGELLRLIYQSVKH